MAGAIGSIGTMWSCQLISGDDGRWLLDEAYSRDQGYHALVVRCRTSLSCNVDSHFFVSRRQVVKASVRPLILSQALKLESCM